MKLHYNRKVFNAKTAAGVEQRLFRITKDRKRELEEELEHRTTVLKPSIIQAISNATAMGDLKENADYDAAKNDQAENEFHIKRIQDVLNNIDEDYLRSGQQPRTDIADEDSHVFLHFEGEKGPRLFHLSDPSVWGSYSTKNGIVAPVLSIHSPLGSAVYGKAPGTVIDSSKFSKYKTVKIVSIK